MPLIPRRFVRRHFLTVDLRALTPEHRAMFQAGLNVLDAPLFRIRKATGRRVPVTVRDLSRDTRVAAATSAAVETDHHSHDHSHGFHVLADPENRAAALGLYWLPTRAFPAGRVEVHSGVMGNPPLAVEVLIAELAHSFDLCAMTEVQRRAIWVAVHDGSEAAHQGHGWWEEAGNSDYWSLMGETFMALFLRAFAPSLPRPMEARQPWVHKVTDAHAAAARRIIFGKL